MILLSPGGDTVERCGGRPERLMVATVEGTYTFARSADGYWRAVERGVQGCFVSALTRLKNGAVIAATHGVGVA